MNSPQNLGRQFEKSFSKKVGARLTPGSGNQWNSPMDLNGNYFLWSLKHTVKESFRLTRGMLYEVLRAATGPGGAGGVPAMAVSIQGEEYVILRIDDFLSIVRDNIKIVNPTKADEKRASASLPKFKRAGEVDG